MPIEVVSVVAGDVVSLEEVKQYVQVPTAEDNSLLQTLVRSSVLETQRLTGRKLLTTTCNLWLAQFPNNNEPISIPFPPLLTIVEITYIDSDGITQTLASADFFADPKSSPGRVLLTDSAAWPGTQKVGIAGHPHPVKVKFTCGYGTQSNQIPDDFRTIVKSITKLIFDNPNPVENSGSQPAIVPLHTMALIDGNRDQTEYPAGTW